MRQHIVQKSGYSHICMMLIIEGFLSNFSELWMMLSSLEYIGKHKENIVVGERIQRHESATRSDWNLLD